MHYRADIDGLRAVAVVSVVLFHSNVAAFSGGFVGVDIFFVISGYLITSIIKQDIELNNFTFARFYERRARRILPALLFMLLVVTMCSAAILLPRDLINYGKILIYSVLFAANFRLAGERGYFDASQQENPLLHIWSLSVEEQFYFVWPVLLLFIYTIASRWRKPVMITTFLVSLILSVILVATAPRSAFYHLPSRGWELLAGAILAFQYVPVIASAFWSRIALWTGAILLGAVFVYDRETAFPGLAAIPVVLGTCLIIHAGRADSLITRVLSAKPVVFIGKISYSLYLWHWPLLVLPAYVLLREPSPLETAVAQAAALCISIASWRYIERPFRRTKVPDSLKFGDAAQRPAYNRPLRWVSGALIASVVCAVSLIGMGSFFQESKGFEWRLNAEARAVNAIRKDSYFLQDVCPSTARPKPKLYECSWGSANTGLRIAVWGDSHADHYLPAIQRLELPGTIYMTPACLPLLVDAGERIFGTRVCEENNREVMKRLIETKPSIVFLGGQWSNALGLDTAYRSHLKQVAALLGRPITEQGLQQEFSRVFNRTVTTLTKNGIAVVLLSQVPQYPKNVLRCVVISKQLGFDDSLCSTIPLEKVTGATKPIAQIFNAVAGENPLVQIYSPLEQLCVSGICGATREGRLLYSDDHHLSLEGSLLLSLPLKKSLARNVDERLVSLAKRSAGHE